MPRISPSCLLSLVFCSGLFACAGNTAPSSPAVNVSQTSNAVVQAAASALPTIYVHKTPTCGCCKAWVSHLEQSGFSVRTFDHDDLGGVKERLGVPAGKGSCHTAEVDGYLVEGHVPASDIKRLLKEKPQVRGLVLPGMPLGSPGMETPDGRVEPYTVELVEKDGSAKAYSQHGS